MTSPMDPAPPALPDGLIDCLAAQDRAREERTDRALAALTPREQALIREAAVMGYFQGTLAPGGEGIPPDMAVLRLVVATCISMPDLYPNLSLGDQP